MKSEFLLRSQLVFYAASNLERAQRKAEKTFVKVREFALKRDTWRGAMCIPQHSLDCISLRLVESEGEKFN